MSSTPTITAFAKWARAADAAGGAPQVLGRWAAGACLAAIAGCCQPPPSPLFPADYATTFREVRNCRRSPDHDLNYIRVLCDPVAFGPYSTRTGAFPEGSVILKEEYADDLCTDLVRFSAMQKEPAGYFPAGADWHWQRLAPDRTVTDDGPIQSCAGCHQTCGVPPDGYEWTCAVPP